MILQHFVLPTDDYEAARPLYVKGCAGTYPITIHAGSSVDFRTFFNLFPSEKYKRFAGIDHIILRLDCEGTPVVDIYRYGESGCKTESVNYSSDLIIDIGDEYLLGVVVRAEGSDVILRGGAYCTDLEPVNAVHLAHVICTYHRENDVKRKLDWICGVFGEDPSMKDSLTVYVIDNGRSFAYDNDLVKVVPSPNYGGSGGFTRGMIEAVNDGISTHVTLNDDDAMLDPETIFRTISFFRMVSEEKRDLVLGGTIFDKDKPTSVHEAGAFCRNGKLYFNDEMDATEVEGCLKIDRGLTGEECDSYFAWCYMSVSCDVIRRYGFGLPLFFQFDDVEYSLRIGAIPKITMCGISVWHPFMKSHSVNKSYFGIRNTLVATASNGLLDSRVIKRMVMDTAANVFYYRYLTADAQLQALRDFKNGPEKVFSMITEGYSLFDEYKKEEPLENKRLTDRNIKHSRMFMKATINGLLFPSIGELETDMSDGEMYHFYRKGKVYYRTDDGKEIVCKRSPTRSLSLLFKIVCISCTIFLKKGRINRMYSKALSVFASEEEWWALYNKYESNNA